MFERLALIRREPFTEVAPFETGVDRLLNNALSLFDLPIYLGRPLFLEHELLAPMEIFDRDSHMVVRLEVPGVKMEDTDISVSDGMLTIKGEKKLEKEIKEKDCYCSERSYDSFRRTLSVPKGIDGSKISATYDKGILEVSLPKLEEKQGRKVTVKAKKAKG
jgi:HSP20 family protein